MRAWAHGHKQSLKYILGIIKNKEGASTGQFIDELYSDNCFKSAISLAKI